MHPRLRQFASFLKSHQIDAYLITSDVNIRYLTDFPASESWVLVSPKKSFYITDSRYILEARSGLSGIKVEQFTHSIIKTMFGLAETHRLRNIAFDDRHVSLALFKDLKQACPGGVKLLPKNNIIEQMREIKTVEEINHIRECLRLNLDAYHYLKKVVAPGMTERDVLLRLEHYVKSKGAGFSFSPIIASGPNSCFPHARVSDRKIRNHEPVLVDMGIDINGYKSDLTRMFFFGKITPLYQKVYDSVAVAQQKAIRMIRPGIPAAEVDHEARNYLAGLKLAKYFGHSLGHGVGLEIHEAPRLSGKSQAVLKEGMVVTVEPAVYLPGQFGVRIEDMVLVTKEGCEVLSRP